jgi:hypothetical protein
MNKLRQESDRLDMLQQTEREVHKDLMGKITYLPLSLSPLPSSLFLLHTPSGIL